MRDAPARHRYVSILRKIAKALLPAADYNKQEAVEAALEDWESDRCGQASLNRVMFMDAM